MSGWGGNGWNNFGGFGGGMRNIGMGMGGRMMMKLQKRDAAPKDSRVGLA